jgi:hypothetical protein
MTLKNPRNYWSGIIVLIAIFGVVLYVTLRGMLLAFTLMKNTSLVD